MRFSPLAAACLFIFPAIATTQGTPEETVASIDAAVKNKTHDKSFLSMLGKELRSDESSVQVKERAAWALGQLGARSQLPALLEAAQSKGLIVRSAALGSLMRLRAIEALPILEDIAQNDPVLSLRQRATVGLGLMRTDKAIATLAKLAADPIIEVRGAAALAMSAHQSPRNDFGPALKQMAGDESSYVTERAQAGMTMAQRKNERVREFLESDDADIRLFAAVYLESFGGGSDLKALKDAANGEADDDVQYEMQQALSIVKVRVDLARKREAERKAKEKEAATTSATK